jgi:glycosyltransferase involved in cell wall biosynthesis
MSRSVCLIAFSPIARDARVLRQIEYLGPHYDLTVIGLGPPPPPDSVPRPVRWHRLPEGNDDRRWRRVPRKVVDRLVGAGIPAMHLLAAPGAVRRAAYERWYWSGRWQRAALAIALEAGTEVYHANDWTALPVAAEAARRHGARLIFDAHEYAPLELENRRWWMLRQRPVIDYFLRKYVGRVDGFTTVSEPIARRYEREFGVPVTVVHNAPRRVHLPQRPIDPAAIRLVHHGAAVRDRRLEQMILAVAAADSRFSLHMMLVPAHRGYVEELMALASRVAPARIAFPPPVAPDRTTRAVAEYDMGFYLLEPCSYNNRMAAPNKFFDYIAAGMPVCIGPSPAMAEIVERFGLGCVASSFAPSDVAAALGGLDAARLAEMQRGAQRAAEVFHADAEMGKLVALYRSALEPHSPLSRARG